MPFPGSLPRNAQTRSTSGGACGFRRAGPLPLTALAAALAGAACVNGGPERPETEPPAGAPASPAAAMVDERFHTERTRADLDSIAVWHGPDADWLIATSKAEHTLYVYDAGTGARVTRVERDFLRPNGIAVADDLAFVVERDHHRVQVLHLPGFEPAGTFGDALLTRPYGIAVVADDAAPGRYMVWVTDNYEAGDDVVPPDDELGRRVQQFRVTLPDGTAEATHVGAFGETSGPGVLHTVESIHADPAQQILVIADEDPRDVDIKVYSFDGSFTGRILGAGVIAFEPEGIALARCGERGYWLVTDQDEAANVFHLFDRATLRHAGAFAGPATANTDGVALTLTPLPGFPHGAFYAVDDDGRLAAFDWADVVDAAGLPEACLRAP